jgi:hypothetical protein
MMSGWMILLQGRPQYQHQYIYILFFHKSYCTAFPFFGFHPDGRRKRKRKRKHDDGQPADRPVSLSSSFSRRPPPPRRSGQASLAGSNLRELWNLGGGVVGAPPTDPTAPTRQTDRQTDRQTEQNRTDRRDVHLVPRWPGVRSPPLSSGLRTKLRITTAQS